MTNVITETELIKQGVKKVSSVTVTELPNNNLTVRVQLKNETHPLIIVTRRERTKPKEFLHRERLLKRLAKVFPHIDKLTIERTPEIEIRLKDYR